MKIVKLTAENYKRLSAVEITPEGNLVLITGKNEVGKSSVLDAIESTLCGGHNLPKEPIKQGEHRGSTVVEMEDYIVTRKYFGDKSTLKVEQKGELKSKISRPQEFLDSIVGNLSFDPLAFSKMQESEQRKLIMDFVGLDLSDLDKKIEDLKIQRSEIRKIKENAAGLAASLVFIPDLPEAEISGEALREELKIIESHNKQVTQSKHEKELLQSQLNDKIISANETAEEIKKLMEKHKKILVDIEQIKKAYTAIPDAPLMDKGRAEQALIGLSNTNEKIRANIAKRKAEQTVEELTEEYTSLGQSIKDVEFEKTKRMTDAKMPIVGLTIAEDGLRFNNIPLSQVNDANKIKISVAIAMAMNPKLRVLRVNGNDLDTANLKALGEMVAGKDYQIWVEKIDESGKLGFVIEDGTLMADKPAEEQK